MLHGEIKVNRVVIGHWSARRTSLGRLDGQFEYETLVTLETGSAMGTGSVESHVWHHPKDGAAVLASAVLATAGCYSGLLNKGDA